MQREILRRVLIRAIHLPQSTILFRRHSRHLRLIRVKRRQRLFRSSGGGYVHEVCYQLAHFLDRLAPEAVAAAVDAQRVLGLPVRMGVGTGTAELRGGDYFGPALNRAARVMAAGHGGQVLLAASTAAVVDGLEGGRGAQQERDPAAAPAKGRESAHF